MREHGLYAQAMSQLFSCAAVLWMKHMIGLAAGSPAFAVSAEGCY